MEGRRTVLGPSIIVSELAAVIMGDAAVASETAIIPRGTHIMIHISILFKPHC
jgi:hypothetical protein